MYTHTLPLRSRNRLLYWVVLIIVVGWMAAYPIYRNYYNGLGIEQYERFKNFQAKQSMFFNPWQYRILCPLLAEGIYVTLDNTLFKLVDFSKAAVRPPENSGEKNAVTKKLIEQSGNPEFIKYNIVFVILRFLEHLAIFYLAFRFFSHFTTNDVLAFLGVMMVALFMGNAVADSDLSFNTYMDVILYLAIAVVIVEGLSYWWVVPITVVGALNRETSILIPVLFCFSKFSYDQWPDIRRTFFSDTRALVLSALSGVLFVVIFVLIRSYYGYQPPTMWRVPTGLPMLKLNLLSSVSVKTYMEMFGVFGVLPLLIALGYRNMNYHLKIFLWVLVPVWFAVHLWSVVAYQSRLFLVPTALVFIPALLQSIEQRFQTLYAKSV